MISEHDEFSLRLTDENKAEQSLHPPENARQHAVSSATEQQTFEQFMAEKINEQEVAKLDINEDYLDEVLEVAPPAFQDHHTNL